MLNVFEMFATLGLDSSEFDSGLKETESKASGFSEKLSDGLGKAMATTAKITATAVATTSTAVAGLVKSAVSSYADYEQLVGGVETLFGVGGQSLEEYAKATGQSLEEAKWHFEGYQEAQQAVFDYANEAYKTAGLSANEYMETVTGFSASLISSLGGDTLQASEYANQAIIDMSDNANKMGSSMESIQNAYAGFAKQNYTMLDNLKLGYGGTKEEMQRLLSDAEKLPNAMGQKFDLSNYADIIEAIHLVQENMGITGTTAKEASETISGSFGMVKASWQNLVTGLANKDADLGALIGNFTESVGTAFNNVMPVVEQGLEGVVQLAEQMLPMIAEKVPAVISEYLPQLIELGAEVLNTLLTGINENMPLLIESALSIISTLGTAIIDNMPLVLETALQIILGLALGISEALPELIPAIVDIVVQMVETLIENIDLLIDASIALILGLAEGLINAMPQLLEKAPVIVEKLVEAIIENLPKIIACAIELIIALATGLIEAIPRLVTAIPRLISAIVGGIKDGIKDMISVGGDLVDGLWQGINEKWGNLVEKVKGMGGELTSAVKEVFDIHSPSKVFKWIGEMNVAGFEQGMKAFADGSILNGTIKTLNSIESPFESIKTSPVGVIGTSQQSNSINQTINVYTPTKSADELAREIRLEAKYGLMRGVAIG